MKVSQSNLEAALKKFGFKDTLIECKPYGNGHINDTFLVTYNEGTTPKKYILQAINRDVFPNCENVMKNLENVTEHLKTKVENERELLLLKKADDGEVSYTDENGNLWRSFGFIDASVCLERPEDPRDFFECGYAFGRFQYNLSDFPADKLYEIIPDFHNTAKRFEVFNQAVKNDAAHRADSVKREIEITRSYSDFYGLLFRKYNSGELPLRVSHNDTKSNNVMLDEKTHKALCVIDLDTIMPGFSVTDFGDAIRFGANTAAEDEKNLDLVKFDMEMFKAFAKGFISGSGNSLLKSEIMLLPEGAKMMTLECGMRFLTDYLNGDTYFKTDYPEHNLDRCRTQFKLAKEMENSWDAMKAAVEKYCLI